MAKVSIVIVPETVPNKVPVPAPLNWTELFMVVVVIATVPVLMFPQINPELVADTMKTWKIDELMVILPPVI